jgi:iron(III) transport system permease protein
MKLAINNKKTFKVKVGVFLSTLFIILLMILFLLPILSLGHYSILLPLEDLQNWEFIKEQLLPSLFYNTFILCIGTITVASVIGIVLAISLELTSKKSQLIFELLLTLPIAFPVYVYSFAYVGAFEWTAPIPKLLRYMTGQNLNELSMKNMIGAILIFSLALYPYIFIPLRLSLKGRWKSLYKVGLLHGHSQIKIWWDIINGIGRMPILMGATIVGMECLSEFGGISLIGIDTFTTAIYTAWSSFFSLEMASRLGLLLLIFSIPLILFEALLNKKSNSILSTEQYDHTGSYIPYFFILIVIFMSLIIPCFQLLLWLLNSSEFFNLDNIITLIGLTLLLAIFVAILSICIGILMVSIIRFKKTILPSSLLKKILPFFMYGYGLPGNLIAIAFLGIGQVFFPVYNVVNAMLMLTFALLFKFQRTAYKKLEVGDQSVSIEMENAGKLYSEKRSLKFLGLVYLPSLKPFYLYGALFIAIEVIKELPLVMILRPMGFNTLSTKIFELTSEGEWERATVYSIPLITLCLLSHLFIYKKRFHE